MMLQYESSGSSESRALMSTALMLDWSRHGHVRNHFLDLTAGLFRLSQERSIERGDAPVLFVSWRGRREE